MTPNVNRKILQSSRLLQKRLVKPGGQLEILLDHAYEARRSKSVCLIISLGIFRT